MPTGHGIMTRALPGGRELPPGFALQNAADYLESAEIILKAIGAGRDIAAIGVDFTASSPLPALADGRGLSEIMPDQPHAYVKLWKHARAQRYAEAINQSGGAFLANFGGKVSGEWLLAKAAEIVAEAPGIWRRRDKFIESGDWLVWRLTGNEVAQPRLRRLQSPVRRRRGYPSDSSRGSRPGFPALAVGSPAGPLTGIGGRAPG